MYTEGGQMSFFARFKILRLLKRFIWVHLNIWAYPDTIVRDAILKHVKPGTRCIDVGAHRGRMTDLMLKCCGTSGMVNAFEPLPDFCHALEDKYRRTRNVFVFNTALGDIPPRRMPSVACFARTEDPLMSSFHPDSKCKVIEFLTVSVRSLDSYHFEGIGFIKIDVEGWEPEVLKGAEETINKYHPVIIAECLPGSKNASPMIEFFESHGYGTIHYPYEILAVKI
jgi:FkbM family methyltransferase